MALKVLNMPLTCSRTMLQCAPSRLCVLLVLALSVRQAASNTKRDWCQAQQSFNGTTSGELAQALKGQTLNVAAFGEACPCETLVHAACVRLVWEPDEDVLAFELHITQRVRGQETEVHVHWIAIRKGYLSNLFTSKKH
eukprot:1155506-Pelagomonas_calceolata.AAC.10